MNSIFKNSMKALLLALSAAAFSPHVLAVPDGINYQAYLTDSSGAAINTTVSVTVAAYNVDVGGAPLWSQTQSIDVDNGLITIQLGNPVNPFPAGLFDGPVFLGLFVAGEEMLPRRSLQSSAFSFKAADADTLNGATAASLDQSSDVSTLQTNLGTLQGSVDSIDGQVSSLNSTVTSVQSDVAANTASAGAAGALASSNDGRISVLEVFGGDITSVVAGAGLSGGAASGDATVFIPAAGISGAMLNPVDTYTVGDLTTNDLTATAQFLIDSPLDILINDDFNGMRWRSSDASTEFASLLVRDSQVGLFDNNEGRYVFNSTSNGIALGTNSPTPGYSVTTPSLVVTGALGIGYARVASSYALSTSGASCHTHGNLACFYGSTTVNCPVGTKVLGGGSNGSSPSFGTISQDFPNSETSWFCGSSYEIANSSDTCYAICARIE